MCPGADMAGVQSDLGSRHVEVLSNCLMDETNLEKSENAEMCRYIVIYVNNYL